MKLYLYYVGKPRDPHANALAADYIERVGRYARSEMREIKPGHSDPWARHDAALKVLLDPTGKPLDSARFAAFLARALRDARDLVFVVGGAEGLPPAWRERADLLLSLSPMTYAHELARVMLAEQLYRAFATLHRHPYAH